MDNLFSHAKRHYNVYPEVLGYWYIRDLTETDLEEINKYDFVFISSDIPTPIESCDAFQMHVSSDSQETTMWLEQSYVDFDRMPSAEYTDVPTVGFVGRLPLFPHEQGYALHRGFEARAWALGELHKSLEICTDFHTRTEPTGDSAGFWNSSLPTFRKDGPLFKTNMLANQYQVCARGNANWSLRFYETLAYGRIPIYIDSNGKFPIDQEFYPSEVPWVWIKSGQDIEAELLKFHGNFRDQREFSEVQQDCRRFYFEHFSHKAQIDEFDYHFKNFRK